MNPQTAKYFERFHEQAMTAKTEQLDHHARNLAAAMLDNDPLRAGVHILCAHDLIGAELSEQNPLWLAFLNRTRELINDQAGTLCYANLRAAVEDDYRERRDSERAQD